MKRYLSLFAHRTRSLWVVPTVVAALSVILAACGGSTTTAAPTSTTAPTTAPTPTPTPTPVVANVKMVEKVPGHYSFDPPMLMVKVGTQVVWTNASDAPHTVTSDTGSL